jgi:murein DD-endopeptidase MepM/ murein hydrolase activator NlpD
MSFKLDPLPTAQSSESETTVAEAPKEEIASSPVSTSVDPLYNWVMASVVPDDFLVINDIAFEGVPITSINVESMSDVFVAETLRSEAPVVQTQGRHNLAVTLSLAFNTGYDQRVKLRRLVSEIIHHPLVFIENNHIRQEVASKAYLEPGANAEPINEVMIFVLESGTLRCTQENVGVVYLDLVMYYFNYKPFSHNFWFRHDMPGLAEAEQPQPVVQRNNKLLERYKNIDLADLRGYEASSFVTQHALESINETVQREFLDKVNADNLPVLYPVHSKPWLYYVDHLETFMPYINDYPSDYIGFKFREYRYISPPNKAAKASRGNLEDFFSLKTQYPNPPPIYDAQSVVPSNTDTLKTAQEIKVETTINVTDQLSYGLSANAPVVYIVDSGTDKLGRFNIRSNRAGAKAGRAHCGIDISARQGTPVRAPAAGKVIFTKKTKPSNNSLQIEHDETGGNYTSWWMHMEEVFVETGEPVQRGQVIGTVGKAKGAHVHLEILKVGISKYGAVRRPASNAKNFNQRINPLKWMEVTLGGKTKTYKREVSRHDINKYLRRRWAHSDEHTETLDTEAEESSVPLSPPSPLPESFEKRILEQRIQEQEELEKIKEIKPLSEARGKEHVSQAAPTRNAEVRKKWISDTEKLNGLKYFTADPKIRNVFFKDHGPIHVVSDDPRQGMPNIVCSGLSVTFGHRIVPLKLAGQHTYTWQFLGAGNKTGSIMLTYAGESGRASAAEIKGMYDAARENSRKFTSFIKDAGAIELLWDKLGDPSERNTILALTSIRNIVVSDVSKQSTPDGVDKHQMVVNFIAQDFAEEKLERSIVTDIETKQRILRVVLGFVKLRELKSQKNPDSRYHFYLDPRAAVYKTSKQATIWSSPLTELGDYVVRPGFPAWLAAAASQALAICEKYDRKIPPIDLKANPGEPGTWNERYAKWGAGGLFHGRFYNADDEDKPEMTELTIMAVTGDNVIKGDGSATRAIHGRLFTAWLDEMNTVVDMVKNYAGDETSFEKYFGSLGSDLIEMVTQQMGECYSDMKLPPVPGSDLALPPEFYIYDDSHHNSLLSSMTDEINMESLMQLHVLNTIKSLETFMKNRFLGGSYISANFPRIIANRTGYNELMGAEYGFDSLVMRMVEGYQIWAPELYTGDSKYNSKGLESWKSLVLSAYAEDKQDVRLGFLDSVNAAAGYLGPGRKWSGAYNEDQLKHQLRNKIYGDAYMDMRFGPNREHAVADKILGGEAMPNSDMAPNESAKKAATAATANQPQSTAASVHTADQAITESSGPEVAGSTISQSQPESSLSSVLGGALAGANPIDQIKDAVTKLHDWGQSLAIEVAISEAAEKRAKIEEKASSQQEGRADKAIKNTASALFTDEAKIEAKAATAIAIGTKTKDISVRRAFPTFKIYFIEEDRQDTSYSSGKVIRAFDDFYSYSAIQEIKVTRSRKIPADLAIIRMTNVGGTLLRRRFGDSLDAYGTRYGPSDLEDNKHEQEYSTGIFADTDKENPFERMILRDGVKVQIRLGYSSDPELLDTVFLGQIVEIAPGENGKIIEIMCQGYGAELEGVSLGPVEDGPIFFSTQMALSGAIIQDSIVNFGRRERTADYNPAEIRQNFFGGRGTDIGVNPLLIMNDLAANVLDKWGQVQLHNLFNTYRFLNDPQDDNIYAPPPSIYASSWDRWYNNACMYRPFRQTPWEIFKEHELRHPGHVSLPVPYGHSPRMTMFFGTRGQNYWAHPPSKLELMLAGSWRTSVIRLRGMRGAVTDDKEFIKRLGNISKENPRAGKAIRDSLSRYLEPRSLGFLLGKTFGRYRPFRNYHFFDSQHHILANRIRTSVDGTFNEVEVLYFQDDGVYDVSIFDSIGGWERPTAENVKSGQNRVMSERLESLQRGGEGVLAIRLDENIPEENIRSYREGFPSCITDTMAKRYAQGLFMRHLRDAYKGELVLLGEPSIKPYDVCYLNDTTINMTGPIEVEAVTHIFNRDNGFVSIVTPDLVVDANEFSTLSLMDATGAALGMAWGLPNDAAVALAATSPIVLAGMMGAVKYALWSQEGDPVIATPLTLGGKPFLSVTLGQSSTSLFLSVAGKWRQYWDDLEAAWDRIDIGDELFHTGLGISESIGELFSVTHHKKA